MKQDQLKTGFKMEQDCSQIISATTSGQNFQKFQNSQKLPKLNIGKIINKASLKIAWWGVKSILSQLCKKSLVDTWVDGWDGAKAGLRITCCNQKLNDNIKYVWSFLGMFAY